MGGYLQQLWRELDIGGLTSWLERILAVLLSLTIHESAHGFAAYALGDETACARSRISLNPLHHIDWLGLAMMLFAGFGWAKPVPVDPRNFRDPQRGMGLTALAGPVSNLLLTVLALLLARLIYAFAPSNALWVALFGFLAQVLAPLSLGLGLFNLLPIPPLDGAKVLGLVLPETLYFRIMRYERYGFFILLALVFFNVGGNALSRAITFVYSILVNIIF